MFGKGGEVILYVVAISIDGCIGNIVEKMMEIIFFDGVISNVVLEDYELSLQLLHQLSHSLLQAINFIPL